MGTIGIILLALLGVVAVVAVSIQRLRGHGPRETRGDGGDTSATTLDASRNDHDGIDGGGGDSGGGD